MVFSEQKDDKVDINHLLEMTAHRCLFKVINAQTERNKFTYKCPSCRVTKEKFDCATPLAKKLTVENYEQL